MDVPPENGCATTPRLVTTCAVDLAERKQDCRVQRQASPVAAAGSGTRRDEREEMRETGVKAEWRGGRSQEVCAAMRAV